MVERGDDKLDTAIIKHSCNMKVNYNEFAPRDENHMTIIFIQKNKKREYLNLFSLLCKWFNFKCSFAPQEKLVARPYNELQIIHIAIEILLFYMNSLMLYKCKFAQSAQNYVQHDNPKH